MISKTSLFAMSGLFLGAALFFASFPISEKTKNFQAVEDSRKPKAQLGSIKALDGRVSVLEKNSEVHKVLNGLKEESTKFGNNSLIKVDRSSSAMVTFDDGPEIVFGPFSEFIVETIQQKTGSLTLLNIFEGNWSIQGRKSARKFKINYRGQRHSLLSSASLEKKLSILVENPNNKKIVMYAGTRQTSEPHKQPVEDGSTSPTPQTATLSNKYIDDILAKKRLHFQNCQKNAVRNGVPVEGRIESEITILPSGRVSKVNTYSSTVSNQQLKDCISEVFLRTKFRSFGGLEIVKIYPIVFGAE